MQSEQGGHHRAAANIAGCSLQYPEQQDDVQRVQQQIHIMVRAGIELKELDIGSVREPGQRMPIGRGEGGKRPGHRAPVQTGLDVKVVEDVVGIIVVGKGMTIDRVVKNDGRNYQEKTESEYLAALRGQQRRSERVRLAQVVFRPTSTILSGGDDSIHALLREKAVSGPLSLREISRQSSGLLSGCLGFVLAATLLQGLSQQQVTQVGRLNFYGTRICLNRRAEVSGFLRRQSQADPGADITRTCVDRSLKVVAGGGIVAEIALDQGQIVVCLRSQLGTLA